MLRSRDADFRDRGLQYHYIHCMGSEFCGLPTSTTFLGFAFQDADGAKAAGGGTRSLFTVDCRNSPKVAGLAWIAAYQLSFVRTETAQAASLLRICLKVLFCNPSHGPLVWTHDLEYLCTYHIFYTPTRGPYFKCHDNRTKKLWIKEQLRYL